MGKVFKRYHRGFLISVKILILLLMVGCKSLDYIAWGLQGRNVVQISLFGDDEIDFDTLDKIQLKGFSISDFDHPMVRKFIAQYQTPGGRRALNNVLERSYLYIDSIKKVFKEKGIPEDLAYLPIIESAFKSTARSPKFASGLWQFMYHTGKMYGLNRTYWHDDRLDPKKSTLAAAYHLKYLYKRFDNWLIVLAAYNAGGGKLSRGIKKYNTSDYWQLCKYNYLKAETKNYVPKFIAASLIAKNPAKYGFPAPHSSNIVRTSDYTVTDSTDLELIAQCAEIKYSKLKLLNPSLLRWATPPRQHTVIHLPEENYISFVENFSKIPADQRVTFRRYTVRIGENLTTISRKFKIENPHPIAKLNRFKSIHRIQAGESIIIPIKGLDNARSVDKHRASVPDSSIRPRKSIYTFVHETGQKDSLYTIARKYRVDIVDLMHWNEMRSARHLSPGQMIIVKIPAEELKD